MLPKENKWIIAHLILQYFIAQIIILEMTDKSLAEDDT